MTTEDVLKHARAKPQLYSFVTADDLCQALTEYVIRVQNEAIERRGRFMVALSGGSLPKMLAKFLTNRQDNAVRWDKWKVFFADERLVPLDSADSNYALSRAELFSKVPELSEDQVYPIDTSCLDDAQEVADQYEQSLAQAFGGKDAVRNPVFDLLLLGMGPDGHTCSLFPGHPLLKESERWVAPIEDSPKPPPRRVTLTYNVVNHAHHVAFVLSGEGKRDMLAKVLDEPQLGLPSSLVRPFLPGEVSFFADAAASDKTRYPPSKFNL